VPGFLEEIRSSNHAKTEFETTYVSMAQLTRNLLRRTTLRDLVQGQRSSPARKEAVL
jgi:hypothetical protein